MPEFLPRTWNNGMMEYWKVEDPIFSGIGFKGSFSFINILNFPVNMNFTNNPLYHFPITQYSTIPLFHYSNIPIGV